MFAVPCPDPSTSDLEQAFSDGRPLVERLRAVEVQYARAAATLAWLAQHPDRCSLEDGRAISRRLRGLRKLVEVELRERKQPGPPDIDLHSPAVEQVVGLLLRTFEEAASAVLPGDQALHLMEETRLRARGWQDCP
jgi:hypothetical protein